MSPQPPATAPSEIGGLVCSGPPLWRLVMTAVAEWGSGPEALPERVDVCLVNMPYASLNRPSLALGLLKAVLEREGIATRVLYPNLTFAETIGLRLYHLCSSQLPKDFLVGEWTFAEAAFRDATRASDEEYLER